MLRVVFFGIHQIGVEALTCLLGSDCRIETVVTKPGTADFPQRVEQAAMDHGLSVHTPTSPKDPILQQTLKTLRPDLIVVGGYHRILPKELLDIPTLGAINLHASLLPAYRGPVPWKWVIMHGLKETGMTVHRMLPTLDSGDILAACKVAISPDDTGGSLFARLSSEGGKLLAETVKIISRGKLEAIPQDESVASYFSYPDERQTQLDWHQRPEKIRNLIRALDPSPGAWSICRGQKYRFYGGRLTETRSGASAGTLVARHERGAVVATSGLDMMIERLVYDSDEDVTKAYAPEFPGVGDVFEYSGGRTS